MNVSLAKKMLKATPFHILHPKPDLNTPVPLNTGATIPALGLGTWRPEPGTTKDAVIHAIKHGYRHIDTGFVYGNEAEVGEGIKEALASGSVKREDLFVTAKLWGTFHSRVDEALDESLRRLQLDYVDLYLMHWPVPLNPKGNDPVHPKLPDGMVDLDKSWTYVQTWDLMENLVSSGKARAIGVCNFSVHFLENLLANTKIIPAVNQIESHPHLPQQDVVQFCAEKNIHVTMYNALGSAEHPFSQEEGVQGVARKHKADPATILLSYHVARGGSVLVKNVTPEQFKANSSLIVLDAEDVEILNAISLNKGLKRYVYPPFEVDLGFPDK